MEKKEAHNNESNPVLGRESFKDEGRQCCQHRIMEQVRPVL